MPTKKAAQPTLKELKQRAKKAKDKPALNLIREIEKRDKLNREMAIALAERLYKGEPRLFLKITKSGAHKLVPYQKLESGSLVISVGIGTPKDFIPYVQHFGKKAL